MVAFASKIKSDAMDESETVSQSLHYQENEEDVDGTTRDAAASGAAGAPMMVVASSSGSATKQNARSEPGCVVDAPCSSNSMSFSSPERIPLSSKPTLSSSSSLSAAPTTRSSETREVHHVTFAEPCDKYVHSDSGIVLSPDDSGFSDTGEAQQELTDDESDDGVDEATGQVQRPVRCPAVKIAVPGPPIIKLHRSQSTESQDNPFLSDGELRRKADYIISHSTFLRTYVRVADPDLIPVDQTKSDIEFEPITPKDVAFKPHSPDSAPKLNSVDVLGDRSIESPVKSPRKITSKAELTTAPNGDAEEPLLARKKEDNGQEITRNKQTRSKKGICCVVQ